MTKRKHIVVAGAGILGAAIAWHLACRGSKVTVIDRTSPAAQASGRSFGWINATHGKRPYRYHLLSRMGVMAWRDAATRLALPVQWGGSLAWSHAPLEVARQAQDTALQRAWGSPTRLLSAAEMLDMEPNVEFAGAQQAGLSELDGWVDAMAATAVLLAAARAAGAEVHTPCELTGTIYAGDELSGVTTAGGSIDASHLVVACGANSDIMEKTSGIVVPQQPTAGVIAFSKPMPPTISRVLIANGALVYQRRDGRLVMGEAQPVALPGAEQLTDQHTSQAVHRIVAAVTQFLPQVTDATIATTTLGWRPMPEDGHPAVGRSPKNPGVYAAVTHSGVTLAIILARLIALELLHDLRIELLTPFRPERFSS